MSIGDQIAAMFDAIGKGYVGGIVFMFVVIGIFMLFGKGGNDN